jgi:hypothetical protein
VPPTPNTVTLTLSLPGAVWKLVEHGRPVQKVVFEEVQHLNGQDEDGIVGFVRRSSQELAESGVQFAGVLPVSVGRESRRPISMIIRWVSLEQADTSEGAQNLPPLAALLGLWAIWSRDESEPDRQISVTSVRGIEGVRVRRMGMQPLTSEVEVPLLNVQYWLPIRPTTAAVLSLEVSGSDAPRYERVFDQIADGLRFDATPIPAVS